MSSFIAGLDFGQSQDYSALMLNERFGFDSPYTFHLRFAKRWPLGTDYVKIVAEVHQMLTRPPLKGHVLLAVDRTGVGRPGVDMLRSAGLGELTYAITITGGADERHDEQDLRHWHVPKRDLVSTMRIALETERLRRAKKLRYGDVLDHEFKNFRLKITKGANDTYEAWREQDHDDMVLAEAIALWVGERFSPDNQQAGFENYLAAPETETMWGEYGHASTGWALR